MVLATLLFVAACFDIKKGEIPNLLIIIGLLSGGVFAFARDTFVLSFISSVVVGLMLIMILFFSANKSGLGGADIKLFIIISLFLNLTSVLVCILLSCIGQLLLFFFWRARKKSCKSGPFVPVMFISTIIICFLL